LVASPRPGPTASQAPCCRRVRLLLATGEAIQILDLRLVVVNPAPTT
jgi:hypothetical protein